MLKKLLSVIFVLLIVLGTGAQAVEENCVYIYPVYPNIPQNTDYSVTVTQGAQSYPLTVYNGVSFEGYTEGDDYRRFCEFDFKGEAVCVNITINKAFSSYEILPTALGLPGTINGNTVSVTLEKPQDFMIRLDRDDNTILSVFSNEPETFVPSKNTPNLHYYEAGWHDIEGGTLTLGDNESVYLEAGAVLNGRISVVGKNVKIYGRGALRDGVRTTGDTSSTLIFVKKGCQNVTINDIKLLDSNWYNIGVQWSTKYNQIDRVRILSNQVSTDGICFWGGITNSYAKNCFIYNADNVFVFNNDGTCYNEFSNCIVGSTCSILFPQGGVYAETTIKDLYVFRCCGNGDHRHALVRHTYKGTQVSTIPELTIENIDASDCTFILHLFYTDYIGGDYARKIIFKNVNMPKPDPDPDGKKYGIEIKPGSGNYHLVLDNVKFAGELLTSNQQTVVVDNGTPKSTIEYKNSFYMDINMDGATNATDVTYLMQYVAGWNVPLSTFADADLNNDGAVDVSDITHITQYVAGWGM